MIGQHGETTESHDRRLDAVVSHLLAHDARTVLDLGCGAGALIERLALEPSLQRIIGVDQSHVALQTAAARLGLGGDATDQRISLRQASITDLPADLAGADAAALVEVLEHLPPSHLSRLERSVFHTLRPRRVIMTTPNREYNAVYGFEDHQRRHPEHLFEWGRRKFEKWAAGVAERAGYAVEFEGIGVPHAYYGSSTQLALFQRID
jgi:small RNA 2'-O-methyltransferase